MTVILHISLLDYNDLPWVSNDSFNNILGGIQKQLPEKYLCGIISGWRLYMAPQSCWSLVGIRFPQSRVWNQPQARVRSQNGFILLNCSMDSNKRFLAQTYLAGSKSKHQLSVLTVANSLSSGAVVTSVHSNNVLSPFTF